ncbi:glycoside hydrolase family 6 protein [Streptomyces sp. NPDC002644]
MDRPEQAAPARRAGHGRRLLAAAAGALVAAALTAGLVAQAPDTQASRPQASGNPDAPTGTEVSLPATRWAPVPSPQIRSTSSPLPGPEAGENPAGQRAASGDGRLYLHPDSQVGEWVRGNRDDRRRPVIESRIATRPAAVWFADPDAGTVAARVRAVTSRAAAEGRVPVLVAYTIPHRDCGQYSAGGTHDLRSYDRWVDRFAAGLGSGEAIVILEPDAVAQSYCLSAKDRDARFASLARAGRVIKRVAPRARVYFDAGHSGWIDARKQAGLLRQAGAASPLASDGVFSNVSNFRSTGDEVRYVREVLAALDAPASHGAVIDTSRNGNGPPAAGEWCDPSGRRIGRAPALSPGEARVDGYLWVKLPGEFDGCRGRAGVFDPAYAYELAR